MQSLDQLEQLLRDQPAQPPIEKWHPDLSGDIDIRITADGTWLHEGEPIRREPLVALFASILRRESDGEYYLVTPVEKWRLRVDDAPLMAVELRDPGEGAQQRLGLRLNTGVWVAVDAEHPLQLRQSPDAGEQPYLQLWHGLEAKLSRPVYYQLAEQAIQEEDAQFRTWWVESCGGRYPLGRELLSG